MDRENFRRAFGVVLLLAALPMRASASCPTNWWVSRGGTEPWELLRVDPLGLSLGELRFGMGYDDPTQLSGGRLDFDGDGHSDVFAAVPYGLESPLPEGEYAWIYSSGGSGDWQEFGRSRIPPSDLRFGDFDADELTDVFFVTPRQDGLLQWNFAPTGGAGALTLQFADTSLYQLRFGDFNGDRRTDVFTLGAMTVSGYRPWLVSYSGVLSYYEVYSDDTPIERLHFTDINGAGTDVVMEPWLAGFNWDYYSPGSNGVDSLGDAFNRNQFIGFGDMDGNGGTSEAVGVVDFGGSLYLVEWLWPGTEQTPVAIELNPEPLPPIEPAELRLADFDGDGLTDILRVVSCPEPQSALGLAAAALALTSVFSNRHCRR
jgi:hypothetical protein